MLSSYIKPKGFWWNLLPLKKNLAHTIFQTIYLPQNVYDNLNCPSPNIHYQALLLHEEEHRKRSKQQTILWCLKYMFNAKFRFEEELIAYKIQQKFLTKYKKTLNLEQIARHLSSGMYLWCASFENAKNRLEE